MITVLNSNSVWDPGSKSHVNRLVLAGLSTDKKPTGTYGIEKIANGSSFFVIDTNEVHHYDEENAKWYKGNSGGGGGGGGGDDDRPATDGEIDNVIDNLDDL